MATLYLRTALFWFIMQQVVVISYWHFGQPVGPILRVQESKRKPVAAIWSLYRGLPRYGVYTGKSVGSLSSVISANRVEESWKPLGKLKSLKIRTACFFEMSRIGNPATRPNNHEDLSWVAVCSLLVWAEFLCINYINFSHRRFT